MSTPFQRVMAAVMSCNMVTIGGDRVKSTTLHNGTFTLDTGTFKASFDVSTPLTILDNSVSYSDTSGDGVEVTILFFDVKPHII